MLNTNPQMPPSAPAKNALTNGSKADANTPTKQSKSAAAKECTGDPTKKSTCKFVHNAIKQAYEEQKNNSVNGEEGNQTLMYSEIFEKNLRTSIEHFYKCGK